MTVDPKVFNSLRWRLVGPHRGGRVVAVAGDPVDAITDGFFRTSAVGAIAVAPSDPNGSTVLAVSRPAPPVLAAQTVGGNFVASSVSIKFDPSLPCPLKSEATMTVV
jgi:hypothetical protein